MSLVDTTRSAIGTFRREDVPFKAASIAYYAIASFVPLLLVALAVLTLIGAADVLVEALRSSLPAGGDRILNQILSNTRGRSTAGVLGFLVTLWGGIQVFRGLSVAFDEIYTARSDLSLFEQVKKSLVVLSVLFLAFALLSATSVALAYADISIPFPTLAGNVLAVLVLVAMFLPLYYVLPPVPVTVRHALPGTVVAAIGWVLLQVAFFYYTQNVGAYAAYGFIGAILLFVTFLYLAAIILLTGAVVNVVLDR